MLRSGLALAVRLNAPVTALRGYVNLSDVLEFRGRHAEAAQVAREGLVLARRVGMTRMMGSLLAGNLAMSLLKLGPGRRRTSLSRGRSRSSPRRSSPLTCCCCGQNGEP